MARCSLQLVVLLVNIGVVTAVALQPAAEGDCILPATAKVVTVSGRVNGSDDGSFQFDWSAVSIQLLISGARSISISLKDQGNHYDVLLDSRIIQVLNTTSGEASYPLISGLNPEKVYHIELIKRTEAFFGVVTFKGFSISGPPADEEDECVLPQIIIDDDRPAAAKAIGSVANRRIEFIGDSISCGYGADGQYPCSFSAATENAVHAYDELIATAFGAELYLECWSGKGVVRNYGEKTPTSPDPFPVYYPRTLAEDANTHWNFSQWIPDAVVINLGTNDYSTQPAPSQDVFETGYKDFIATIRNAYRANPRLQMFLLCGPMIGQPCCSYVQNVVSTVRGNNIHYIDMQGILKFPDDYGCDGHPNVYGHQKMAAVAKPAIAKVMGW